MKVPLEFEGFAEVIYPIATTVKIDGVNVTDYLRSWNVERTIGDAIGTAKLEFAWKVADLHEVTANDAIEIWRWNASTEVEDKIFSGYVESLEDYAGLITVNAKDKAWMLVRQEVTYSYDYDVDPSAGVISEIFKDLVETWGGLTATVQASGGAYILKKFVCNHATIYERCKRLADAMGWQFYYDVSDDSIHFEPYGFVTSTATLTVGDNVVKTPKWQREDITEMANQITAIGYSQNVETTEYFSGDASTHEFKVGYPPLSTKVYLFETPDWVLKIGAVEGYVGVYDYEVDAIKKEIIFVTPPPNLVDNVQIAYTYAIPTATQLTDPTSRGVNGPFDRTLFLTDVQRQDDAENRAYNELQKYKEAFINAELSVVQSTVGEFDLEVGQVVPVVDGINDITDDFVVNRISFSYPSKYDSVYVGNKEWRLAEWQSTVDERIHNLEEAASETSTLLQIKTLTHPIGMHKESIEVLKRDIGTSFALGVSKLGYDAGETRHPKLGCDDSGTWTQEYYSTY